MLPADLQRLVNKALTSVRTNPKHEMNVEWRIAIFAAMEAADPLRGRKAHAWAAVHTAEFALSCWKETGLQHKSWISESRICLAQAKHHLSNYNRVRLPEREDSVQNLHCTVSDVTDLFGNNQYSPDHPIECIYRACYAALCEASGANPFQSVSSLFVGGERSEAGMTTVGGFAADALPFAAYAYATEPVPCDSKAPNGHSLAIASRNNPERLLAFWQWWLDVALPDGWKRAQLDSHPVMPSLHPVGVSGGVF